MRSIYRVLEENLGVFRIQRRGKLWGWNFVMDGREKSRWSSQDSAESWVKQAIPQAVFRKRVLSEWFINGEKKPNGK